MNKPSSSSLDRILVGLHLKKDQGKGLTREQAMSAWPIRNPSLTWKETEDGIIMVDLPRRQDWAGKALALAFMVPESKPIQLDEIGTFVWRLCDGEHMVSDIVSTLSAEFKLNKREAEVSLTQYLATLGKRGMVAFAVPRDVAEEAGLRGQELPVHEEAQCDTEPDT